MADSRFRWNAAAGRYVASNGRFVTEDAVRRELDRVIDTERKRVRQLAEQLRTRGISPTRWEIEMRGSVKRMHMASVATAKGGWAQMAPADNGRAGRYIRDQYAYLERFRRQVDAGLPLDGRFLQRADLYAEAARGTYHRAETAEQERRGMTEERNLLHPADHCSECVGESARGWVPIGTLVPIGQRICRARCRCTKRYR